MVNKLTVEEEENTAVKPKVRFIGNISANRVVIPDLKNSIDESGLTLNPGDKFDLLQYYSAAEINRSRGLDNAIKGITGPDNKEVQPILIKVLESMDEKLPDVPIPIATDPKLKGSSFEAPRNFADDNLDELDAREEKEYAKLAAGNRKQRN